jgi:hypothetical protein
MRFRSKVVVSESDLVVWGCFADLGLSDLVWVDGFDSDWWKTSELLELGSGKRVVVLVSPELHGRNPDQVWKAFADVFHNNPNLYICTDYPWDVLEMIEVG